MPGDRRPGGPVLTKLALQGPEWNFISRHRRAAAEEVRYLHIFCPQNSEVLAGVGWRGGCHKMVVLLSTQELSVAFHVPTTEAAGELATQSEERCSGLPASLSPVAGPDQNKGRKCGPQTAGELG